MRDFKKYDVWKLGHEVTLEIYQITKSFPNIEKYQLVSQMQRAAYSIPSNFSEGCGRGSDKDFNRFLHICLGSAHELEYFILLAKDLEFIEENVYQDLDKKINLVKKRLYRLSEKLAS